MFPTDLSTELGLLKAVNNLATLVTAPVSATQQSLSVASAAGFPASGVISIDSEVIAYDGIDTSGGSPVFQNLVRGFDGTTATTHPSNSRVEHRWVAAHHNLLSLAIRTLESVLGVGVNGAFDTVAERISTIEPLVVQFTSTTDWTFTVTRGRPVSVSLWKATSADTAELFTAPITQTVNPDGTVNVTVHLTYAVTGYAIVS